MSPARIVVSSCCASISTPKASAPTQGGPGRRDLGKAAERGPAEAGRVSIRAERCPTRVGRTGRELRFKDGGHAGKARAATVPHLGHRTVDEPHHRLCVTPWCTPQGGRPLLPHQRRHCCAGSTDRHRGQCGPGGGEVRRAYRRGGALPHAGSPQAPAVGQARPPLPPRAPPGNAGGQRTCPAGGCRDRRCLCGAVAGPDRCRLGAVAPR